MYLHLFARCSICIGDMNNREYNNEEWLHEEQVLKHEVVEVSKQIQLLFDDANFTLMELFKLDKKISLYSTTDEKRKVMTQVGLLLNRLRINAEELTKVDKRHEELKQTVLKFYHMPPDALPPDNLPEHLITIKDIKEVLVQWREFMVELEDGESWKDG